MLHASTCCRRNAKHGTSEPPIFLPPMPVKYASTFCSVNFNRDTTFDGATSCMHACMNDMVPMSAPKCNATASIILNQGTCLSCMQSFVNTAKSHRDNTVVSWPFPHPRAWHCNLISIYSDLQPKAIKKCMQTCAHTHTNRSNGKMHATQARSHFECLEFKFGQWCVHFVGNPPCIEWCMRKL